MDASMYGRAALPVYFQVWHYILHVLYLPYRYLEHELTMARLKIVDTRGQLDTANSTVSDLQSQLADKAALVARLEEDLLESRKTWSAGAGKAQQAGKGE